MADFQLKKNNRRNVYNLFTFMNQSNETDFWKDKNIIS